MLNAFDNDGENRMLNETDMEKDHIDKLFHQHMNLTVTKDN